MVYLDASRVGSSAMSELRILYMAIEWAKSESVGVYTGDLRAKWATCILLCGVIQKIRAVRHCFPCYITITMYVERCCFSL